MTKNHHRAHPSHEVGTPFHCSHQMILPSLSTSKNCLNSPLKESNYLSTTTFSGRLVKTPPFFQISLCRYRYSLLVDFGQVPPLGINCVVLQEQTFSHKMGYYFIYRTRSAFTGRTFSKAVVLLTSPRTRKVPLGADKLKLYLSKNIIDAVQIPLHSNEESLQKFFTELFTEKLGEARYVLGQ